MMTAERVDFVGVGRMSAPMARRRLAHGEEILIRDVNDAAVVPFKGPENATILRLAA